MGGLEGERCQVCGIRYLTWYSVPDEVWALITPKTENLAAGLLCPTCADGRARSSGLTLYWRATAHEADTAMCPVCGLPKPKYVESTQGPASPLLPGEPDMCLLDHEPTWSDRLRSWWTDRSRARKVARACRNPKAPA